MKIAFIEQNQNINRGSYRVHIRDLDIYLKEIGIDSKINPKNINNYDVIIFGKGTCINTIKKYKKLNKKLGITTPTCREKDNLDHKIVDFCIVGSVEEKDSLSRLYKNIFIIPQIESIYRNPKKFKTHEEKKEIIIGYHGNQNHLNHIRLSLKNSFEKLYNNYKHKYDIKFIYTCSNNEEWVTEKPNIPMEFIKWDINNIENTLLKMDIGVVPNICEFKLGGHDDENITLGRYSTDTMIRFKNKSNGGRSFVFHQMKIPVIADYTPSNMRILADLRNGYAVCSEEGWYRALEELLDYKKRIKVSENAYQEFNRVYNPLDWAKMLASNLEKI